MKIVADQNIPFVKEAFSTLGRVTTCAGEDITPDMVRDCGMLLVRSVTPVNEKLLQGSSVRFVATATIGTDHVDLDYLKQAGIGFCSAPGSNANSVAEYVLAALAELLPTFENKTKQPGCTVLYHWRNLFLRRILLRFMYLLPTTVSIQPTG
jgi:erythronate-4-phosphate dehydrogenase